MKMLKDIDADRVRVRKKELATLGSAKQRTRRS